MYLILPDTLTDSEKTKKPAEIEREWKQFTPLFGNEHDIRNRDLLRMADELVGKTTYCPFCAVGCRRCNQDQQITWSRAAVRKLTLHFIATRLAELDLFRPEEE